MNKLLSNSRYIILLAVLCCLVAAISLLVIAGIETAQLVVKSFTINLDSIAIKMIAFTFIEVIDILLLASVFYITALGLYELFIDENLPTPGWLHITHLDDLKSKLIGVVIVILLVLFLGQVVNWDGERNIIFLGVAIAFVIAAIALFQARQGKKE